MRILKILAVLLLCSPVVAQQITLTGGVSFAGSVSTTQAAFNFAVASTQLPSGTYNVVYTPFQLQTTGGTGAVTCQFLSGPLDLPSGMTFTNATCTLSGTPTQVGTFTFLFQANDSGGHQAQARVSFSIFCTGLQMSNPVAFPPADKSTAWSYQVQTSGGITPLTFGASGLATGLSINSSTGIISGTPSASGNFTPTVTVTDSCPTPQSVSSSFTETVHGALVVTTNTVPAGVVGTAYSTQFANAGGTSPFVWSVDTLPTGLTINSSTGVVSGTPTAVQTTTSTFTVTDNIAATATAVFSVSTACNPLLINTTLLPNGTQNVAYQQGIAASGGNGTLAYAASNLPTGLSINASTGVISGTPSTAGSYDAVITVTDSCPTAQVANTTITIVISANVGVLTITTPTFPPATESVPYGPIQMTATGGVTPYTWSLLAGAFPTGITMTAGVISGTPTSAGTTNPDIKVVDNVATTTHTVFPITVSCAVLTVTTSALPPATQSTAYSFGAGFSGGTGTVTWGASGLPTGLTINSSTGVISGTPSTSGTFSVILTATDSCSPTPQAVPRTLSLQVNAPLLAILTSSLPNGLVSKNYSISLVGAGGTPLYTWSVTVGTLPTGLSLNSSTGVISGTPSVAATTSFTIQLADNAAHTATHTYSIIISTITAADNTYCSPSGTWLGATTDGPATLPTRCMNTAIVNTLSPGTVRSPVAMSGLQSDYTSAACGDTIQIIAGTTSSSVPSLGPKNCDNAHWITIESVGVSSASFPSEGTRNTPCSSGIPSLPNRPAYPCTTPTVLTAQLVAPSSNNALRLNGADHLRFIGIEFTRPTTPHLFTYNLIDMSSTSGVQTNNIIFDRIWCHGVNADGTFPQNTTTDTSSTRCLYLGQSNHIAVIDSYISDFYDNGSVSTNGNSDAQCVGGGAGGVANSGWGVYKFVNNHCEASGEGILLGGSSGPPLTPSGCTIMVNCNLDVPADIEVRRNYFFKPQSWNGNTTTVNTVGWPVGKNGFEMKIGARALFEGNVIENTWNSAQVGWCWSTAPKNQSDGATGTLPTAPTALTNDFTYRYNYCYNAAYGIGLYQSQDAKCSGCQAQGAKGISIHDNVIADDLNLGSLPNCCTGDEMAITAAGDSGGLGRNKLQNVTISHNTFVKGVRYLLGFGANTSGQIINFIYQNNLVQYAQFGIGSNPSLAGCSTSNSFSVLLTNCVTGTATVDHNAVFGWVGTLGSTWPTNASGLGNWFFTSPTATANYLNSAGATVSGTVGFTNYSTDSGFNPSNFTLSVGSVLHNAGSDGADVGANISILNTKIAGVRQ